MKILVAIISLFLTASATHAQDYEVVRFEASDYRDFTMGELEGLLGENATLIPMLSCNGIDEFHPFKAPLRTNPRRDSLRVRVPKTDTYYIYQEGLFLDEEWNEVGIMTLARDPFVLKVASALARFENISETVKLLRMFEESYFPLVIDEGRNSFSPTVEGERNWSGIKMAQAAAFLKTKRMSSGGFFSDIGVGGTIFWNPTMKLTTIESDGVRRKLDNDVALAHEMYHAFDSIRGMLDMGLIKGEDYPFDSIVEYRGVYFENLVRRELGIKYRKYYSDPAKPDSPDLLDDSGEPIYIPSPCL